MEESVLLVMLLARSVRLLRQHALDVRIISRWFKTLAAILLARLAVAF